MRTITVLEHLSLDGVMQAPGGPDEDRSGGFAHGGWIAPYTDPKVGEALQRKMHQPFDLLLGRKTFEIWASFWPHHGEAWPEVNAATKYVASNTLTSSPWQPSVFLGGDIVGKIATIKQQPGPDLHVWGSAHLVQTLLAHDLVDALWLMIVPITLGRGKKLFGDGTMPAAFTVTESLVAANGVMVVHYRRAGAVTTGSL